jgi:hypothetical protein
VPQAKRPWHRAAHEALCHESQPAGRHAGVAMLRKGREEKEVGSSPSKDGATRHGKTAALAVLNRRGGGASALLGRHGAMGHG